MVEIDGVKFEEPGEPSGGYVSDHPRMMYAKMVPTNEAPGIVVWLINKGVSEQQAVNILIAVALLIFGGALFMFFDDPKSQADFAAEDPIGGIYESY